MTTMKNGQKPKKHKTKHPGVYRYDDGRWWIQVTQHNDLGEKKFRRTTLPSDTPIDEVLRRRAALVLDLAAELREAKRQAEAQRQAEAVRSDSVTVFAERWLIEKAEAGDLRESTQDRYSQALEVHILPVLGDVPVPELTRDHVVRWLARAEAARMSDGAPYSQATLVGWWRIVCGMLKDAAAEYRIPDPTSRLRRPKSTVRRRREQVTLTAEQLGVFLGAVQVRHPAWYDEIFADAFSGLRPGEMYALMWPDLDDAAGVIRVNKSVSRKGKVTATKTGEPRDVAYTKPMRLLLTARRRRMIAEQHPGLESGLVFPSSTGGHRLSPALGKVLNECRLEAGIPTRVTAQVLRRTINTLLVEEGVANIVIQQNMGHVSDEMTDLYSGVHAEVKCAAIDRVWRLVAGKKGTEP